MNYVCLQISHSNLWNHGPQNCFIYYTMLVQNQIPFFSTVFGHQ